MSIEQIDLGLCTGCGICVNTCPMDVLRLDTFVSEREEFPPCRLACPGGVNMRVYISLLKDGMIEQATKVLREALLLPRVTSRVCHHPCESECARRDVDEAVNINSLERFVADYPLEEARPIRKLYAAKVAIVGSGPAGLAAAQELARMGYPVTVFEAMPELGGMLRFGIPEYRLPREVLDTEINYIKDMGIEFLTDTCVGKTITIDNLKNRGYEAIFWSTGAQLNRKLELDGMELNGVVWGLDFLKDINNKRPVKIKKRILVVGGGNVAMEAALTALRLGAKEVRLACLESASEIPAHKDVMKQAVEEGIDINVSWGPKRILGDGRRVTGIELVRCVSVFDKNGVFRPSFNEQETRTIDTDMVILAIGQIPDLSLIDKCIRTTDQGTIEVDLITLETSLCGFFAGGDVVSGPASVVEAIASGKKASISIDRYLRGEDLKAGRGEKPMRVRKLPKEGIERTVRQATPVLFVDRRSGNFNEIKKRFSEEIAKEEAQRCMTCGSKAIYKYVEDCMLCDACEVDCPQKAIYVSPIKHAPIMLSWG